LNKITKAHSIHKKRSVRQPKQDRAIYTRQHLLNVAGKLLSEVGLEDISTNMICARAEVSPPTLYRYFQDKHAVIEALAMRLMEKQNELLFHWLDKYAPQGIECLLDNLEEILRETAYATASEPGGAWIARALHASPKLIHIRVESHRLVTNVQAEALSNLMPGVSEKELWHRIRLMIELGYAALQMIEEEDRVSADEVFAKTARILRFILLDDAK
jgi:AcrR family transcriptional regulator